MNDIEEEENALSPVELMVAKARQVAPDSEYEPPRYRMVSFRVPLGVLASVDAFASITAQSRNSTMIDLLQSGIWSVANSLDDPEPYFAALEHFKTQHLGE